MKILAMDTSNATLAVAVHEDNQLLGQIQTTVNKNHSISLMPAIDQLMQMVNVKPTDLDRIVVAQGPGSYTGLRIGVTTAKTLADTLNIDLVGVSSLKVLAANCVNISEIIVPIFDARRKNVYAQAFVWQENELVEVMPAGHYPIVEVLAHFKDQAIYLVGKDVAKFTDEIAQYAPQAKVNTIENWQYPSASILAQLGCTQTPVADVASFLPTYLKLVEAEEKWLQTHAQEKSDQEYVEKSKNFIFSFITRRKRKYHAKLVSFNALDYLVREIFPTDMKELLRIERVVYEGDLPWTRSIFLSELYSKKPHLYLGVFDKRELIAFIGMRVDIYDGHVTNLAVLPQYQKQGIASFLLGEVEKFARKNVCMQMSLEVRVTNLDAQRLYRKFGFISRRRLPRYYDKNHEDALEMVKMLDD